MTRLPLAATLAVSALLSSGCATTSFVSTWTAPGATPLRFKGEKVVAMVVVPDPGSRRTAEDALAAELVDRGVQGIAAYKFIPEEETTDRAKVRARLEQAHAAGIVVMQVTRVATQVSTTGPVYMGPTYYGYYDGWDNWGWTMPAYTAGYIQTDTLVYVETLVYSLKQNKLVWAGKTETINPSRINSFVAELTKAVVKELKKAGLVGV